VDIATKNQVTRVSGKAGALSGFPVPQFFGLSLQGVEVSKNGGFLALFANLNTTP